MPSDAALQTFGGLDVLVNKCRLWNVSSVEETSLADFRAQIETNLFGVIIMMKAVLPYFRERRQVTLSKYRRSADALARSAAQRTRQRSLVWRDFQNRCPKRLGRLA